MHDHSLTKTAAEAIKAGGIVAFPTETVYGLGADAFNAQAVAQIFTAKGRPAGNPLIVHVADREMLDKVAREISPKAELLIKNFWPGPLTLILPKQPDLPLNVTAGLDTVAVRMPDHETALELIRLANTPIAAPSANISGKPSAVTATQVRQYFPDLMHILDDGHTAFGIESTVLTLSPDIRVLRLGAITPEQIEKVLGEKVGLPGLDVETKLNSEKGAIAVTSPGSAFRHYAPHADIMLVDYERSPEKLAKSIKEKLDNINAQGLEPKKTAVIALPQVIAKLKSQLAERQETELQQIELINFANKDDLSQVARNLYDILWELDQQSFELAISHKFPESGLGNSLNDRLIRASQK